MHPQIERHGDGDAEGRGEEGPVIGAVRAAITGRALPVVTISYAQSLDGSIAALPGYPLALSCPESAVVAHRLRSLHDAILVGIGTVLSDDPRLTVRLVQGPDPQPVILDSRLRFPLDARMLKEGTRRPWIITGNGAPVRKEKELEKRGAHVIRMTSDRNGHVDVRMLPAMLAALNVHALLVEGGAQVITSFLSARLVDQIVVTIAPLVVGGLRVPYPLVKRNGCCYPRLDNVRYEAFGRDLVLRGEPSWDASVDG